MRTRYDLLFRFWWLAVACLWALPAQSASYPQPREGDWVARDLRFHDGAVMPEVRLHYNTVGEPTGEPVLVLRGTGGSGAGMLDKNFAEERVGPGQPRDASRYFIILPGVLEREIKRVKHGSILIIAGSADTAGHGITGSARHDTQAIDSLLRDAPRRWDPARQPA